MSRMIRQIIENTWRTFVQVYNEFSLETSVHGVKYTTTVKSVAGRFFWVIVLTFSILAAWKLASLFYERHQSASMATLIISDNFPTWTLPLPAITLCSGSIATKEKVISFMGSQKRIYMPRGLTRMDFENSLKYLRESIYPKNHNQEELDKLQQILSANRLSLLELFENISPNCTDLLIMCRFEDKTVPCEELIQPVVTPYGICCSFNYKNPDESLKRSLRDSKDYRIATFGDNFALSLLLKPIPSHERVSSVIHGDGIKVLVHESFTYPTPTVLEFVAASGHETVVQIHATELISSAEILRLPARVRGCFSSPLAMRPYRESNCFVQCRESVIRKLCGCVSFFATFINGAKHVCNLTHVPCLARVTLHVQRLMVQDSGCDCLPDCESVTYNVGISQLPLTLTQHHPGELYKKAGQYENASILHFTLAGQSTQLQQRELMLTSINLVSSLGGVFGLFLGCSFISVVEIFYFFCIYFIRKLRYQNCQVLNIR